MALSPEAYLKLLGITGLPPGAALRKHLIDMMSKSIGGYMDNLEVVALGTVETQDLQLQVSTKVLEEVPN